MKMHVYCSFHCLVLDDVWGIAVPSMVEYAESRLYCLKPRGLRSERELHGHAHPPTQLPVKLAVCMSGSTHHRYVVPLPIIAHDRRKKKKLIENRQIPKTRSSTHTRYHYIHIPVNIYTEERKKKKKTQWFTYCYFLRYVSTPMQVLWQKRSSSSNRYGHFQSIQAKKKSKPLP